MMKEKTLFTEQKFLSILVIPFIISIVSTFPILLVALVANNPQVALIMLLVAFTLFASLLLFYKLHIKVDEQVLEISFGIGLIKKKFLLSDIDTSTFYDKKIPWYYGVGWRYDFKGNVLFSADLGTALTFRLKNSENQIMIVTKNREALKDAIIDSLHNHL
ncbi:MAG TPA: hypothetical protein VKY32_00965 [Flavobacterium sp.]|nr:hypothetical protein [Flavobacterium sp.]